jgi:trimeric autotransporter adhesin
MQWPVTHSPKMARVSTVFSMRILTRHIPLLGCILTLALFPQSLKAQLLGDIAVTTSSQTITDGVSFANPKSIPSAVIDYTTQVANRSVLPLLPDALVVTNPVPQQLILYVGDIAGPGSGPVLFAQGTRSSQLICVFSGIADGSDCLEFSNNNGASFNYQPVPDADGYDAAVTHIRIRPQGLMAPALLQPSSFVLRYRMKVK